MSHRAIIDTNVLVSGLGWAGPPAALLDAIFDGRIQLVTSPALLDELRRVLEYPRLAQVLTETGMTAHALVDLVAAVSTVVTPTQSVAAARDANDNRVLEAALAGDAEMVVSGDDDLLSLRAFEGVTDRYPDRGTEANLALALRTVRLLMQL